MENLIFNQVVFKQPDPYIAFEVDARALDRYLDEEPADDCLELLGIIFAFQHIVEVAGEFFTTDASVVPDFYIDRLYGQNDDGTLRNVSGGFLFQAAQNILIGRNSSDPSLAGYQVVSEQNSEFDADYWRANGNFQFEKDSDNDLSFCFFPKAGLKSLTQFSERIVFSGAQLNLGLAAFQRNSPRINNVFTFKAEGDMRYLDAMSPRQAKDTDCNEEDDPRFVNASFRILDKNVRKRVSAPQSSLFEEVPGIVLGLPCPPTWIPIGHGYSTADWQDFLVRTLKL
ncbi:MAG: hypothetical protein MRZ79_04130 [Bacteroidia bacterium]|nr:hypothetical protein [Bacteroidia bacterium]